MRWPFVSRARYKTALARAARLLEERDTARADAATWHATAARASEMFTDTTIVNNCLTRDLTRLQQRLDDALWPNDPAVENGTNWQARRTDKPTAAKEGSAS